MSASGEHSPSPRVDADTPRTEGTEPQLVYPGKPGHSAETVFRHPRPVWVRLDSIAVRDPDTPRHVNGSGLDMTGEVPGLLTHWVPTYNGDWLARVNYQVPYADGRAPLRLNDQLVPGYALRPRRD